MMTSAMTLMRGYRSPPFWLGGDKEITLSARLLGVFILLTPVAVLFCRNLDVLLCTYCHVVRRKPYGQAAVKELY